MAVLNSSQNLKNFAEAYWWGLTLRLVEPGEAWRWCQGVARHEPAVGEGLDFARRGEAEPVLEALGRFGGHCDTAEVAQMVFAMQREALEADRERMEELIGQFSQEIFQAQRIGPQARKELNYFAKRWRNLSQGVYMEGAVLAGKVELRNNMLSFFECAAAGELSRYQRHHARWPRRVGITASLDRFFNFRWFNEGSLTYLGLVVGSIAILYLLSRSYHEFLVVMFGLGLRMVFGFLFPNKDDEDDDDV